MEPHTESELTELEVDWLSAWTASIDVLHAVSSAQPKESGEGAFHSNAAPGRLLSNVQSAALIHGHCCHGLTQTAQANQSTDLAGEHCECCEHCVTTLCSVSLNVVVRGEQCLLTMSAKTLVFTTHITQISLC